MESQSRNSKILVVITLILIILAVGTYTYGYISAQTSTHDAQLHSLAEQGSYAPLIDESAEGIAPSQPAPIDSYETKSKVLGIETTPTAGRSTHPEGTTNSPYTAGIDGYNYDDPQDYENQP